MGIKHPRYCRNRLRPEHEGPGLVSYILIRNDCGPSVQRALDMIKSRSQIRLVDHDGDIIRVKVTFISDGFSQLSGLAARLKGWFLLRREHKKTLGGKPVKFKRRRPRHVRSKNNYFGKFMKDKRAGKSRLYVRDKRQLEKANEQIQRARQESTRPLL